MSKITIENIDVVGPDGLNYNFHVASSGQTTSPAVLWLHGSGPGVTALTNWNAILEDLASDFFNIAPDIVGFGESTHPDPPPNGLKPFTELRVATLAALLDRLGLTQVDLVGNSMGGIISLCFALAHPERVRRIVLMGTGGAPIPPTAELLSLIFFYEDPSTEAMAELMKKFVYDPSVFGDQLEAIAAERMPMALRPEVERSHRATFSGGDPLPINETSMSTVSNRVLVIHGDSDRLMPLACGEWYANSLPNSRLEVIEQAGHWLQIEHHDRFVETVRSFLNEATSLHSS